MRKIFVLFIIIFMITGCSNKSDDVIFSNIEDKVVNYNLVIDDRIKEDIYFGVEKSFYDSVMKESDIYKNTDGLSFYYVISTDKIPSMYYDADVYYKKDVIKKDNLVGLRLSFDYNEDEFIYNNFIMSCFESYDINSTDDYFEVVLMGEFYCLGDMDKLNINVSTDYNVIDSNGKLVDNKYNWVIDKDNYDLSYINFKISRDYNNMSKDIVRSSDSSPAINIMKIIGLCIIMFVIYKLYLKLKVRMDL